MRSFQVAMRPNTISLLHATRQRADQALSARERWLNAAQYPERLEHIFAFDADDNASLSKLSGFRHVVVKESNKGCVAAWNLAARASGGEILVQLSDDWLPIRHWDTKIADRFRDVSKPGVLRVSDGRRVDDLLAFAIFTRAYLELLGGDFLAPEYFGVYSDDEFSFRAYQNGVVIDARDIVLEHRHPSFFAETAYDETHRRQNEAARYREGRKIFLRRNPSARGHWLHEGTEQRYYLPPCHYYAQNIIAPSFLAPSPLGRALPYVATQSASFSYQLGDRSAPPTRKQNLLARVVRLLKTCVHSAIRQWHQPQFRSTLWDEDIDTIQTLDVVGKSTPLWQTIPVFIIHHEQPGYLNNMVDQLLKHGVGCSDIVVIDNASADELSQQCLKQLEDQNIRIDRLERNFGPHEIFAPESGIAWPPIFALTDPDLEFDPRMPSTFREDFLKIALACNVWKCGSAISLADANLFSKEPYLLGKTIEQWERQYWEKEIRKLPLDLIGALKKCHAKVYRASVDTTFAVYIRDASRKDFMQGVRVSGFYECRHLPWYPESGLNKSVPSAASARTYFSTTAQLGR
jgi:hypothetical protein